MNTIRNARSVVLDNETYLLIESLKRSLATNGTADLQSTIDDGIKLCDILLGQYGLVASLHEDQTSLSDWKEKKAVLFARFAMTFNHGGLTNMPPSLFQ